MKIFSIKQTRNLHLLSFICSIVVFAGCASYTMKPAKTAVPVKLKKIAILEFKDERTDKEKSKYENCAKILREKITTALSRENKFQVVERENLDKILTEQKLQASGITDVATAVQIGKLANVDAIMMGSITQYGRTIYPRARLSANIRLVEVETGIVNTSIEIRSTKSNWIYPIELLTDVIEGSVDKLVKSITFEIKK